MLTHAEQLSASACASALRVRHKHRSALCCDHAQTSHRCDVRLAGLSGRVAERIGLLFELLEQQLR
jgi:hypothetical protein